MGNTLTQKGQLIILSTAAVAIISQQIYQQILKLYLEETPQLSVQDNLPSEQPSINLQLLQPVQNQQQLDMELDEELSKYNKEDIAERVDELPDIKKNNFSQDMSTLSLFRSYVQMDDNLNNTKNKSFFKTQKVDKDDIFFQLASKLMEK